MLNNHSEIMTRLVIAAGMMLLASPVFAQVANQQSNSITPPILEEGTPAQAPIIQLGGPAAAPPKVAAKPAPAAAPAVQAAAPSGQGTIKAYGSWSTQCFDAPVGGIKCQMVQKVEMQGQVLLVMALAADSKASTTNLQIAVPLGVAIGEGVQIPDRARLPEPGSDQPLHTAGLHHRGQDDRRSARGDEEGRQRVGHRGQ